MARQKYYAVKVGRGGPAIYLTWDEVCQSQHHFQPSLLYGRCSVKKRFALEYNINLDIVAEARQTTRYPSAAYKVIQQIIWRLTKPA